MGWLMLCCICANKWTGWRQWLTSVYTIPSQGDLFPPDHQKHPTWHHLPRPAWCCEVLMGIRQNSTGEGGKDEVLWLWDSTCVHAQSCLVFQYRCHPGKLSCCLHSHSNPPAELYACSLPTLSPAKWKKPHTKNILKTSHSGISRWQESLPLY